MSTTKKLTALVLCCEGVPDEVDGFAEVEGLTGSVGSSGFSPGKVSGS